ncbi:hypothetical protein J7E97_08235 [Streptomyces sp. ISL-66]|uniref:hypothetical protein n=1 Tax=Streptomyces sp. ISL-66 TaxID=2819186 RepID=UPI001BEB6B87|nr:hypothetical protein [Streptomyces sp. ISL-66]MBT2467862.1 hypothetical protein [Streptomyces sp. ISL-66]
MAIPGNMLSVATESMDPSTSGWTALLNCSMGAGTGGRNGDGTLKLTSTASGEMRARTVSSYTVIPGTLYQVFADASGATVPERIGIRWLTSAGVEISYTWSLTTASASTSWHRIGVAGAAPTGATRAQVVVSASPVAGGVINYFENVYLGLPTRTLGNLFPFGTESLEVDTSGWTADTNCVISRVAPAVQWAVDYYLAGGEVLALTASANGNMSARTVERPGATAGTEYLAYALLSPPTSGSAAWLELRFYNASNTLVQTTRGTLAAPGTGYYQQRVSAVAPSTATTCGVYVGVDTATTGQILRVEGVVVTVAPPIQTGSILPYADASFEHGIAGWTVASGVATLARSTPWGTYSTDGAYSLTVSSATATTSVLRSAKFPIGTGMAGQPFRLLVFDQVTAGGWTMTRAVRWYSAANADLGTTASSAAAAPTPGWWYQSQDVTAPATATQAAVEITLTATTTSSVIRLDQIALWHVLPMTSVTAVDSTASITLTLRELIVDQLLRVYRVTADGARTLVRGEAGLLDGTFEIAYDTTTIEDYEAPLGVPVTYLIEMIDPSDMSVEARTSDDVTIAHADAQYAWLKDPGYPSRNLQVMVERAPDWQRPIEQSVSRVKGRRNAVTLSDVRGGLEGDLLVYTQSDDERRSLHALLDPGHTLLWQAAPGMGVDDMYVSVAGVTEARTGGPATDEWRSWALSLTQQDMPATVGVSGSAGRTWQDVLADFPTWQAVLDAYPTWEDVFLDRRIVG